MADRTLVLLRHAKAEPEGQLGDAARPLAPRGRNQAGGIGGQLAAEIGTVDLALVSSALRARETFRLLAHQLSVQSHGLREELYQAGPRDLLAVVRAVDPGCRTVLVVGHEPTISGTAALLHDSRDDLAKQVSLGVPTATACVLDVPGEWADLDRSAAHLRRVLRPAE